ncbi:capsule assembly Wzi family protein [Larkinella bovis]|uniref:Capsule assembly Wzi family protein n=1 Tax=Larkinella bovis TaxID=683041 RepID=A0ABW0I7R1_9BACT
MRCLFLFATGWLLASPALAQSLVSKPVSHPVRAELELGGMVSSTRQIPFWLRTNQFGMVPLEGPFATLRGSLQREYRTDTTATRKNRLQWGAGVYGAVNTGKTNSFVLPEAFAKVRYGKFEVYAGRRREVVGIGDTTFSSGFVVWSGNSLPVPKVQLHTPDYIPIGGFVKKLVAFRIGYAHGWFNAPYIQGAYLHQKYIYGRFGKPHWKFKLYTGLNHQVQWGGHADYLIGTIYAVNGRLPSSFQDYLTLILARYPKDRVNNQQSSFDGENRIGNHIGSIDYALEWTGNRARFLLYYQHLYEDASGVVLLNFPDGLWGLRYRNRPRQSNPRLRLHTALVEWLPTKNQSGPIFDQTAQYQGADNYYNHGQYREGWSYFGRTIGTPFIMPRADLSETVRQSTGGGFFPNNRVNAWYLGLDGSVYGFQVQARASYSRNFGNFTRPYALPFEQFSALLTAHHSLPRLANTQIGVSVALDRGGLLSRQTGAFLSVKKNW